MKSLDFSIKEVRAGWFVFALGGVEVWASYAWAYDSPKQLLEVLARSVSGTQGYVVFGAEPWTYVLGLSSETLELWYCPTGLDAWYEEDLLGVGPIPERVKLRDLLLREEEPDLYGLALSVAEAFTACQRDGYERQWRMPFPGLELTELKHALGDYV